MHQNRLDHWKMWKNCLLLNETPQKEASSVPKNCECKGWSPGQVVMGGDSCTKGREFKSRHHILDGYFSHLFVVKNIVMRVWKDKNKLKKGRAHFLKKIVNAPSREALWIEPVETVTFDDAQTPSQLPTESPLESKLLFLKKRPFPASFSLFQCFQLTVDSKCSI